MFEYQNNNYENRNQMYDYYQMPETGGPASNRPSGPKKTGKAGKLVKKIGAITLSAALFGSVAAGSFQPPSPAQRLKRAALMYRILRKPSCPP